MSTYNVTLTPANVNLGSEGSLDTSVRNGVSIQRTLHDVRIVNGSNAKVVGRLKDGSTFTDTINDVGDYPGVNGNDINSIVD